MKVCSKAMLKPLAVVAGASLLLAGTVGPATAAPPPANSSWAQTNYSAANNRANVAETTLTAGTLGGVSLRRTVAAAANPAASCEGSEGVVDPILSGGYLYGLFNGYLEKVVAGSGHVVWRVAPDNTFSTQYNAVARSDGQVVVSGLECGSTSDPKGVLLAFHDSDGSASWSAVASPVGGAVDAMAVAGGYVVSIGASAGSGQIVAAHNISDGSSVWYLASDQCSVPLNMVVVAGKVMYPLCDSGDTFLQASVLSTGAPLWTKFGLWTPQAGDRATSTGQHLYATDTSTGKVYDINPANGVTRSRVPGATTILAVDHARVYATCAGDTKHVCGYSLATDVQQWNRNTGATQTFGAYAGGVLYLSSGLALNASSGATIRSIWSGQAHAAVVGDGRVAAVVNSQSVGLYGLSNA